MKQDSNHMSGPAYKSLVYCLVLDMIGSTEFTKTITEAQFRQWKLAIIEQISELWNALDLEDAMLEFTGDGWLIRTPEARLVNELCCVGLVMVRCFRHDMAERVGIESDRIPRLRAAITSGIDENLPLPNGLRQWVGDSARRANRASGYCDGDNLLISETIRQCISRDFEIRDFDTQSALYKPKHNEEPEPLYEIIDLKDAVVKEASPTASYVYVLRQLGRLDESIKVTIRLLDAVKPDEPLSLSEKAAARGVANLGQVDAETLQEAPIKSSVISFNVAIGASADYATALEWYGRMRAAGAMPNVITFSTLIARAPTYAASLEWLSRMEGAGIAPDTFTFNKLIARAPNYATSLKWLRRMDSASVAPDIITFSTLIARAPDYATSLEWLGLMEAAGVAPDVVTFSTLIARAPDYATSLEWHGRMEVASVVPDVVTFSTLIARAPDYATSLEWLGLMEAAGVAPDVNTFNKLIVQAPSYATSLEWLSRMEAVGIAPGVPAYSALFSKVSKDENPRDLIKWYLALPYHPQDPVGALLARLRNLEDIDGMVCVALHYPHLPAAKKIYRKFKDAVLSRLLDVYNLSPGEANPPYAIGICLVELGRSDEAVEYLRQALALATSGSRKTHIRVLLEGIRVKQDGYK